MRKLTIALVAGLGILAAAAPAAAQRPYGDRDRDGVPNAYDRNNQNLRPHGDRDRDGVANRYDRNDYSRGFGYRTGWRHNDRWTPYGGGFNDRATRIYVDRYYRGDWRRGQIAFYREADRNRDGIITRREYERAVARWYR